MDGAVVNSHSPRHAVDIVTLAVIMIIGALAFVIAFLSYLAITDGGGVRRNSNAKTETEVVEVTRREFQTPLRPTANPTRDANEVGIMSED